MAVTQRFACDLRKKPGDNISVCAKKIKNLQIRPPRHRRYSRRPHSIPRQPGRVEKISFTPNELLTRRDSHGSTYCADAFRTKILISQCAINDHDEQKATTPLSKADGCSISPRFVHLHAICHHDWCVGGTGKRWGSGR